MPGTADKTDTTASVSFEERRLRTCALLLMEAIEARFAQTGPVTFGQYFITAGGFSVDAILPRPVGEDDLPWLSSHMQQLIEAGQPLEIMLVSAEQARQLLAAQKLLLECLDDIAAANPADCVALVRHGETTALQWGEVLSNAGELQDQTIALNSVAGCNWKGERARPLMTRISGAACGPAVERDTRLLAQRQDSRDHRDIGKRLELFHFAPDAQPYWLPAGTSIMRALLSLWREEHERRGYFEIASPAIESPAWLERSGSTADGTRPSFLEAAEEQDRVEAPHMAASAGAMAAYGHRLRSYKELPMRFIECAFVHRSEQGRRGLLRCQQFHLDTSHVFLEAAAPEMELDRELAGFLEMARRFYSALGLEFELRLALPARDKQTTANSSEESHGQPVSECRFEELLAAFMEKQTDIKQIRIDLAGSVPASLDLMVADSLGRRWKTGSIVFDANITALTDARYKNAAGEMETPVLIRHSVCGSFERLTALLLEKEGGALPLWLSPVQVSVLPIATRHEERAQQIVDLLKENSFRVLLSAEERSVGKRVRECALLRIPYLVLIGDRELDTGTLSIRRRTEHLTMLPEDFIAALEKEVATRSSGGGGPA